METFEETYYRQGVILLATGRCIWNKNYLVLPYIVLYENQYLPYYIRALPVCPRPTVGKYLPFIMVDLQNLWGATSLGDPVAPHSAILKYF